MRSRFGCQASEVASRQARKHRQCIEPTLSGTANAMCRYENCCASQLESEGKTCSHCSFVGQNTGNLHVATSASLPFRVRVCKRRKTAKRILGSGRLGSQNQAYLRSCRRYLNTAHTARVVTGSTLQ